MTSLLTERARRIAAALVVFVSCVACSGSNSRESLGLARAALTQPPNLQLSVLTNSCGANQVQDFFKLVNAGTSAVTLSDISIKFWADSTSASSMVAAINTGGCVSNAGNASCVHNVSGVLATATPFSPACGPDANHQANVEVTLTTSDHSTLAAGATWGNLQAALRLANGTNFVPATSQWFSSCVSGTNYASDPHFAIYYQGALLFNSGWNAPICRAPHGQQQLSGHTGVIANAPLVGPVPASTMLRVGLALPLRNLAAFNALVNGISDPHSPNFRQRLTPDQFLATYAPTPQDYQTLTSYAQTNGFSVARSFPTRTYLALSAPASVIERAFFVNLNYYLRPDGSQFYAPDREPSLDLALPILDISSLDGFPSGKPGDVTPGGDGSGSSGNYLSNDLRHAYTGCTQLTGEGQALGIIAMGGFNQADIDAYVAAAGIPTPKPVIPEFVTLNSADIDTTTKFGLGEGVETALDIEAVLSIAPAVQVHLFLGDYQHLDEMLSALAAAPTISQFSVSHVDVLADTTAGRAALSMMASLGQSIFAGSGDNGAILTGFVLDNDLRAQSAVTVVGGTILSMNAPGVSYKSETLWKDANGSSSSAVTNGPAAPFQSGVNLAAVGGDPAHRNIPDVSAIAQSFEAFVTCGKPHVGCDCPPAPAVDPRSTCQTDSGPLQHAYQVTLSGASLATPVWAAFTALMNQQTQATSLQPIGNLNQTLYDIGESSFYHSMFNDIADGSNNGTPTDPTGFTATAGFDLATGWGSPKCALLYRLASQAPASPATSSALAAGNSHTCALTSDGAAWCWGAGQGAPGLVSGVGSATELASGGTGTGWESCVVRSDATVACWGFDTNGSLGQGAPVTGLAASPLAVHGPNNQGLLSAVAHVTVGGGHACALRTDGSVWCWGDNLFGQLGSLPTDFASSFSNVPKQVTGLTGTVVAVVAGMFDTCARKSDGSVACWGRNDAGQLGAGSLSQLNGPSSVEGVGGAGLLAGTTSIAVGPTMVCATRVSDVLCWGSGILGDNTPSKSSLFPLQVLNASGGMLSAATVSVGGEHACALRSDGTLACWGRGDFGQLGDGHLENRQAATPIPAFSAVASVSAGQEFTCSRSTSGVVSCWGDDASGEIGDGANSSVDAPKAVIF